MEAINLLTPEQIKDLEYKAINEYKIPELLLMENAAFSAYELIESKYYGLSVLILAGPGNNGGDAIALARILHSKSWNVSIHYITDPKYTSSAKINYDSISYIPVCQNIDKINDNTVIIDGMFGTGLSREFNESIKKAINTINKYKNPIISLDIPSGISALTGEIIGGAAIKANYTVTFCAPKIGLYLYPGFDYCGKIYNSPISIPKELINEYTSNIKLNTQIHLPKRQNPCHKTSYGKVLVIAGSKNYFGAPLFSSKSSLLSGSGYTTLITSKEVVASVSINAPEIIVKDHDFIQGELNRSTFVIYGPGLGLKANVEELKIILKSDIPALLIDGDGLNILNKVIKELESFKGELILTPHPKEASRLLQTDVYSINKDRIASAQKLSKKYKSHVVLKGSNSIISTEKEEIFINTIGSSTLSTAGSGDILCGIIAGLSGYMSIENAVKSGVYIHGKTGYLAEEKNGNIGLTAMDLMKFIPQAIQSYEL